MHALGQETDLDALGRFLDLRGTALADQPVVARELVQPGAQRRTRLPGILDLLNYIEQVEKLRTKPAFSVPTEFFVA